MGIVVALRFFCCTGLCRWHRYPGWILSGGRIISDSYAVEAMRISLGGPVLWPMIETLLWSGLHSVACVAPIGIRNHRKASMRLTIGLGYPHAK